MSETGTGHLTELLYDDGENDASLVCAGHAGDVEPGTGELALELAARVPSATCWAALGYDDEREPFDVWHPPSTAIDPDDYPLLGEIADRGFETVVSLHGLADDEVVVGGATDDETKDRVATMLADALSVPVRSVSEGPYAGVHPENFANWLAAEGGGLQVEMGQTAREDESVAVCDVLATVLRD